MRIHFLRHHEAITVDWPTKRCLYAVFDSEEDARRAEQEIIEKNIEAHRLMRVEQSGDHGAHTADAHAFKATSHAVAQSARAKLWEHSHYAELSVQGHVVLVVCRADSSTAQQIHTLLTRHGAYDIIYLGGWTATYF